MSENEKLKVKELPEEEKQALLAEMKAANLGGALTEYQVKTAREKIAAVNAAKNGNNGEQTSGGNEQNNGDGEQTPGENEQNNGDGEQTPGENEQKEDNKQPEKVVKNEKLAICHICREPVKNGVCTGCGFTFKR